MKIVFNTGQIHLHGGIEKVMAIKANYWARQEGHKVYIITHSQRNKKPRYPLDKKIKLIDLGIDYKSEKSHFTKSNLTKSVLHYKRQKRIFKKINPDFIIYPNQTFDFYWLPYIKRKAKLIKEIHNSGYPQEQSLKKASFYKRAKAKIDAYFLKKYDAVVVLNPDEKKYLSARQGVVLPNPIENRSLKAPLENKQVMAAGRIAPVKRFDELISIWSEVHKILPDWELHFYGEDYIGTLAQLQKQVQDLKLKDVVRFKGPVSDIPFTMTKYSLYLMTSATECFPMVLLEALSVGLPIVSYRSPHGPENIITSGKDGILVKMDDKNDFVQAIIDLIKNKDKRIIMGQRAKENVYRFETKNVMQKWRALFEYLKSEESQFDV